MSTEVVTGSIPLEVSLAHLEREASRFFEVAARSPLQAHVPTYPSFTVETLTAHIGRALKMVHTIIESGSWDESSEIRPAPAGLAVVAWAASALPALRSLLGEVPAERLVAFPHAPAPLPVGAVAVSIAVEVGVHRWDVESVLGEHASIPAELAVLEADKVFETFAPLLASAGVAPIGGTVELRASDVDVRWLLAVSDGRLEIARLLDETLSSDAVVVASAENLALLVWKRLLPKHPGFEVSGNFDVLNRLLLVEYVPNPRTSPVH
jgi:hypothetical protein